MGFLVGILVGNAVGRRDGALVGENVDKANNVNDINVINLNKAE